MADVLVTWQQWLWSLFILSAVGVLGLLALRMFAAAIAPLARKSPVISSLVRYGRSPAGLVLPLLAMLIALPAVPVSEEAIGRIRHLVNLGLLGAMGWLLIRLTNVGAEMLIGRYQDVEGDDLTAREVRTRVHVLRRIVAGVLGVTTVALMLMTFPSIQYLGVSLLASAGFAGLAVGMAARPALENLIAGLQIALTQPIRMNDVVIVEGEWGWIEEIGATYVVVRVWDQRRLVVPLSDFIQKPFQNWTRRTSDILGTVFVYTDYTVPVDEVRNELHRVLQESRLWDRRVWGLQVTNATDQSLELRALMSAADSGAAWDLRCHVREKLIAFLRDRYPHSLPRVRAEVGNGRVPVGSGT